MNGKVRNGVPGGSFVPNGTFHSCEDTFRQLDHVWEERQLKIIDIYNRGEKYVYT